MVVDNDVVIVVAFLSLGTPWWYLVGRIGSDGHERRPSFVSSVLGALIALFTCLVSTGMTVDPLKQDIHDGALRSGAVSQYLLVTLLCFGALLSVCLALAAAVNPTKNLDRCCKIPTALITHSAL
jgi:MFS family permease